MKGSWVYDKKHAAMIKDAVRTCPELAIVASNGSCAADSLLSPTHNVTALHRALRGGRETMTDRVFGVSALLTVLRSWTTLPPPRPSLCPPHALRDIMANHPEKFTVQNFLA
eukprot:PhM_4_TR437/c0_g1_i5/m.100